jgi:hypothetical protein
VAWSGFWSRMRAMISGRATIDEEVP